MGQAGIGTLFTSGQRTFNFDGTHKTDTYTYTASSGTKPINVWLNFSNFTVSNAANQPFAITLSTANKEVLIYSGSVSSPEMRYYQPIKSCK